MKRVKRGGETSHQKKKDVNKDPEEVVTSRVLRSTKRKLEEAACNDRIMRSGKRICTSEPLNDSSDCVIVKEIVSEKVQSLENNILTSTPVGNCLLKNPKFDESHVKEVETGNCDNDLNDVIVISDDSKSLLPSIILTEDEESDDDDIQIIPSTSQKENDEKSNDEKPFWEEFSKITSELQNHAHSKHHHAHKYSKRRRRRYPSKKDSSCNLFNNDNEVSSKRSRNFENRIGRNIFVESTSSISKTGLRPIIIDGSNVAFYHSNNRFFSCKGLEICIKYFKIRGHEVIAFVPQYRLKSDKSDNPKLLDKLVKEGDVVLTPSRIVDGHSVVSYDDRFIVQTAAVKGGVIVTRDNYRDLLEENPAWAETINYRLLQFTWVKDILIFPNDPLGARGPTLEEFLKFN